MLPHASAGPSFHDGEHQRKVPRHDEPDDAERLAERHVHAARDRDRLAVVLVDGAGVEVEDVGDHAHLPARVAQRLAHVGGLQPRELFAVLLDEPRDAAQQAHAIGRLHGTPRGKRGLGRGDGAIGLGSTPARSRCAMGFSVAGLMTSSVAVAELILVRTVAAAPTR